VSAESAEPAAKGVAALWQKKMDQKKNEEDVAEGEMKDKRVEVCEKEGRENLFRLDVLLAFRVALNSLIALFAN
jgi:hypothetical protein